MNPDSLKPNSERTPEQLREMARKGGRASAIARARRKQLRELLTIVAQIPADPTARKKMEKAGISEEATQLMQIAYNLMNRAKRSDRAAELVAELLGERPRDIARNEQLKIDRARLKLEREKTRPTTEPSEDLLALRDLLERHLKENAQGDFKDES